MDEAAQASEVSALVPIAQAPSPSPLTFHPHPHPHQVLALIASFTNVLALKRLNRSDRISFISSFALQASRLACTPVAEEKEPRNSA